MKETINSECYQLLFSVYVIYPQIASFQCVDVINNLGFLNKYIIHDHKTLKIMYNIEDYVKHKIILRTL